MEKKDLLKQRLEINAKYMERIRDQQLSKAFKFVIFVSKIIIGVSIVAIILMLLFRNY